MKVMLTLIYLLALAAVARAQDLLIGAWRMEDGRILKIQADKVSKIFHYGAKPTMGKWEADPFAQKLKRYGVSWDNGQQYDLEISPDGSAIRGTNKTGEPLKGVHLDEVTLYAWCNDIGTVCVNGASIFTARYPKISSATIYVRKDDIVTVAVENKGGAMEMALEALKDNRPLFTAMDFSYTNAPNPDWSKNPDFYGFRLPLRNDKKDMVLGNVKNPIAAIPQREDANFKKAYFKLLVH